MATILVLHDYSGRRTGERPIFAGLYDTTDQALYNLAEYLIVNGHARMIDEPELDDVPVLDIPDTPAEQAAPVKPVSPKTSSRKRK